MASGPIAEPRPNASANNGQSPTAIATLIPASTNAARAGRGHARGAAASRRPAAASTAAVPPKLISPPVDNAARGSTASRTAAATVKVAPALVARPHARASAAAASISHARRLGASAPAISA